MRHQQRGRGDSEGASRRIRGRGKRDSTSMVLFPHSLFLFFVFQKVGGFESGKGQPHAMLLTFVSGRRAVCKNGRLSYYKMDQLVGEVFAFYLDRLLGLNQVLPATISEFSGARFKSVRDRPVVQQHWKRGDPMVCSQYLDELKPAIWPEVFRKQSFQINAPYGEKKGWSDAEKRSVELWGGVIAMDFLTGNTERLAHALSSSHDGFQEKSKRKTQSISLSHCRHNDCHVDNAFFDEKGRLILVDNNSQFFYDRMGGLIDPTTWNLEDMCVFPAALVEKLIGFQGGDRLRSQLMLAVNKVLRQTKSRFLNHIFSFLFWQNEPEGPVMMGLRVQMFQHRYVELLNHFFKCKKNYNSLSFFK